MLKSFLQLIVLLLLLLLFTSIEYHTDMAVNYNKDGIKKGDICFVDKAFREGRPNESQVIVTVISVSKPSGLFSTVRLANDTTNYHWEIMTKRLTKI